MKLETLPIIWDHKLWTLDPELERESLWFETLHKTLILVTRNQRTGACLLGTRHADWNKARRMTIPKPKSLTRRCV